MKKQAVFLFSGQGSQRVGMGADWCKAFSEIKQRYQQGDQLVGFPLTQTMFEGPNETLTKTSFCQPALFLHGFTIWEQLQRQLPHLVPAGVAGLSLGEFTAHAVAKTFDFEAGIDLVAKRGCFMEEACRQTRGGMAAMIGGEETAVIQLAKECDVDVANYNSPGQIVLSGSLEGIQKAVAGAKEAGLRMAKPLNVAGAYHSRLMIKAQDELEKTLQEVNFLPPQTQVASNYLGKMVKDVEQIKSSLTRQVTGSVRWVECINTFVEQGQRFFIEIGPGKVLSGLVSRICQDAEVLNLDKLDDLAGVLERLS